MIKAEVIAASKNIFGHKIATMVVTFPRFILAELNTHRMLSKNSASSRAIPFKKMVEAVEKNPFIPIAWQKDHTGMQGTDYFTTESYDLKGQEILYTEANKREWLRARDMAVEIATDMNQSGGLTKQLCNRLLEPFMWHTVILTATEWENFFALRCPQYEVNGKIYRSKVDIWKAGLSAKEIGIGGVEEKVGNFTQWTSTALDWLKFNKGQAEIHMMALAEAIWDAYNEADFKLLQPGEWHIPFGDQIDYERLGEATADYYQIHHPKEIVDITKWLLKIATARCAGISYTIAGEDGKPVSYEKLIARHDKLAVDGHWSPFEHCAQAMSAEDLDDRLLITPEETKVGICGNFQGFIQYRKMFNNECRR